MIDPLNRQGQWTDPLNRQGQWTDPPSGPVDRSTQLQGQWTDPLTNLLNQLLCDCE